MSRARSAGLASYRDGKPRALKRVHLCLAALVGLPANRITQGEGCQAGGERGARCAAIAGEAQPLLEALTAAQGGAILVRREQVWVARAQELMALGRGSQDLAERA